MIDETPVPATETPETTAATPADTGVTQDAQPAATPGDVETEQPTAAAEGEQAEPSPADLKRKERNRERWQTMKADRENAIAEAARLRAEVQRLRGAPVDYSQIDDPDEALAQRTAARVRETLSSEVEGREHFAYQQADRALKQASDAMLDDVRGRVPDFDAVFTPDVPIHKDLVPFLVDSDQGGDIAYWLAKNRPEAQRLYENFERNPARALVELGRIEARISRPTAKAISKAPRPAQTISGGSSPPAFDASRASVDDVAAQLRKAGVIR